MAEDEIRKHTKAAYNALMNTEKSWKHKLRDILAEILIIVFAVTISIWFHNWSEEHREHKEERDFLTELKKDLNGDKANMEESLEFYKFSKNGLKYFEKVGAGETLSEDSLHKYGDLFFSSTKLQPHISRYEALKGSGKFNIIEDKELLNNIIDLHESDFTHIDILNNDYIQYIRQIGLFIEQHAELNQLGHITNVEALARMPYMRLQLAFGNGFITDNAIPAHEKGIKKCNELLQEIDKFINK